MALVLAVDISYSVAPDERDLQRRAYIEAFRSEGVIAAITGGPLGRVAVTYLEWGGPGTQRQILPWTVVADRAGAHRVAEALAAAKLHRSDDTSIAAALLHAMALFEGAPPSWRRVIDLSADGYNSSGGAVTGARDRVTGAGITINGLAIPTPEAPDLDGYFRDCVIGGPGAMVFVATTTDSFARALRRKLVYEISGAAPERLYRAALGGSDCRIGERRARENYLRQLDDLTQGRSERWRPRDEDWPDPE